MIPEQYVSASLTDDSMMLAEEGVTAGFYTRDQDPEIFDAWAAHIRENWTEKPGGLFRYHRPASESERESA